MSVSHKIIPLHGLCTVVYCIDETPLTCILIRTSEGFKSIVLQQMSVKDPPNYLTVCVPPSRFPDRHFCAVCGYPFEIWSYHNIKTVKWRNDLKHYFPWTEQNIKVLPFLLLSHIYTWILKLYTWTFFMTLISMSLISMPISLTSVTFPSNYTCVPCGARYCSVKCLGTHQDTRWEFLIITWCCMYICLKKVSSKAADFLHVHVFSSWI